MTFLDEIKGFSDLGVAPSDGSGWINGHTAPSLDAA